MLQKDLSHGLEPQNPEALWLRAGAVSQHPGCITLQLSKRLTYMAKANSHRDIRRTGQVSSQPHSVLESTGYTHGSQGEQRRGWAAHGLLCLFDCVCCLFLRILCISNTPRAILFALGEENKEGRGIPEVRASYRQWRPKSTKWL